MIKKNFHSIAVFYLQIIFTWSVAWLFFFFVRQFGVDDFPYIEFVFEPNRLVHLCIHLGLGIVTGILYASFELLLENSNLQKKPYGFLILFKGAMYVLMTYILLVLTVMAYHVLLYDGIIWPAVLEWCTSATFIAGLLHFLIVSTLITIFRQLNYKCGPGILWNMLIGKYHYPREEERIFMFLDLKSSTTIAENLGHIRFSQFIQDCFYDLTDTVLKHGVDIYQYVGDEVILCWNVDKGIKDSHCLAFYFDYMQKLNSRKKYYEKEYGVQPFFKAGIHLGKVTVAEVGVIKKEIAYLGDVLNTAARIQGRCNELNQKLLISQALKNEIIFNGQFTATELGVETLRGKLNEVTIFGIEQTGKT